MAEIRISELTAKGAILESTDLIEISDYNGSTYDTKSVTGQNIYDYVNKPTLKNCMFATTNYDFILGDQGKYLSMSYGSACTMTIPTNASVSFPIGSRIEIEQVGTGQVQILAASGVTLNSQGGKTKILGQFATCFIIKKDTNEWTLSGNITT
jgi:hypothetical protein